jgi:hypothetical protein
VPKDRLGGRALRLVELAAKLEPERLAVDAFVAQIELDTELANQGNDIGQAATGESQVAIKIFKASDDARRARD